MKYFKGKQCKKDIILPAVDYYCRFSLSYCDVSELLIELRISVHPINMIISSIKFVSREINLHDYLGIWMKPIS
ncbi:hypothetical protein ACQVT0_31600, partial [Bacillus toyonensis]